MEDNLFASIMESDKMVSKYRSAPPQLKTDENIKLYDPKQRLQTDGEDGNTSEEPTSKPVLQQSAVELPKYRICIDSVDRVVENSMLKSAFIVYRIRFTRMSDLQSHATWKRYKELATWFSQLSQLHPEVAANETTKFPASADTWMGNQNDPLGEFVLKRKLDVETFLKSLFGEFPALVRSPKVVEFFELDQLPAEKVSVVATRIAARELQDASKNRSYGGVSIASDGDKSSQDLSWYQFDKALMKEILTREKAYDPHTATMRRKTESGAFERVDAGREQATVAEILHFSELHSKMQGPGLNRRPVAGQQSHEEQSPNKPQQ